MKIGRYIIIGIVAVLAVFLLVKRPWQVSNYMKRSLAIEEAVNQKLLYLGLSEKNLTETYNEEKTDGKNKWVYFTKKITVGRDFSFEGCSRVLGMALKRQGAKIISSSGKNNSLVLIIGFGRTVTHLLDFEKNQEQLLKTDKPEIPEISYRPENSAPVICIIIDDFGFNKKALEEFAQFRYPITFSILPGLRDSKLAAQLAHEKGHEVMFHIPLQGGTPRLNEDVILKTMTRDQVAKKFTEKLDMIPFAVGANNHMGSDITSDTEKMTVILGILKSRNMYFVDSFTTPKTVGYRLAKKMGVRTALRQIFLDMENFSDTQYIKKQILKLADLAKKNGEAMGIGHNRIWTAQVLKEEMPILEKQGFKFVYASQIVK